MCGAVYMGGEPDRPSRAAVTWVDFATALYAALLGVLQESPDAVPAHSAVRDALRVLAAAMG